MKAVGNYLLIEKIKEGTKKTKGGLLLSENDRSDIRYIKAKVVDSGEHDFIKKEDLIFYDRHAGHLIEHDNNKYYVIKVQDIVVVL